MIYAARHHAAGADADCQPCLGARIQASAGEVKARSPLATSKWACRWRASSTSSTPRFLLTPPRLPRLRHASISAWPASTPALPRRNEEVVGKLWFNAKTFPSASFVSTGIKALGGNRYQAIRQAQHQGQDAGCNDARHLSGRRQHAACLTAPSPSSGSTTRSAKANGPTSAQSRTRFRSSFTS